MSMPMMRYEQWSQSDANREVPKRLKEALEFRRQFESGWRNNEQILFNANGTASADASVSYDNLAELFSGDLDSNDSWIVINYTFKYLRFLHSQMAANPPSVVPTPTSADYQDRRAAEAADRLIVHGRRQYKIQNNIDLTSLQVLSYGSGFLRTFNDPSAGQILKTNKATRELVMTGDLKFQPLLIWDVVLDPTARCWDDVRYVFIRHVMSIEEAKYRWPTFAGNIDSYAVSKPQTRSWHDNDGGQQTKGRVPVWEYVERGLPWNGMAGRRLFLMDDSTVLSPLETNPNPNAALGVHMLTDIDVPGQVYGKTFVDYLIRLQDVLNRLDSTVLDGIQAHGVVRMVVYDAAETDEDNLPANSNWQIVNVKGTAAQKPDFISPPTLMPDIYRFREQLLQGMAELAGVNDSMFGVQKREMSGFSMQTAINAGNTVRRRLFNKYEQFVEDVYTAYLELIKTNWSDKRKILVTGQEGALSVAFYSGADIANGYDLAVEYGTSFSLDPASRREEIVQIMPFLKEAGYSMKSILAMMRFNDVSGLFDLAEMAKRRQEEIFEEMIAKYEELGLVKYIQPEELEKHDDMLETAYVFRNSEAYKVLDRPVKLLIEQHIREREGLMADMAAKAQAAPAAAGGALGGPPAGGPDLGGAAAALGGLTPP